MDLPWLTGPNAGRTCAGLLGFDAGEDLSAIGSRRHWTGVCPKNARERDLASTASRYGVRRALVLDGKVIYDSETAREVRNRVVALAGVPRTVLTFSTHRAPDIQRGQVIQFAADVGELLPYPDPISDGSWTGKSFVVTEVEQNLGPTSFATRVVAVSVHGVGVGVPGAGWGDDWGFNWGGG
jgi:hypothetical protein